MDNLPKFEWKKQPSRTTWTLWVERAFGWICWDDAKREDWRREYSELLHKEAVKHG